MKDDAQGNEGPQGPLGAPVSPELFAQIMEEVEQLRPPSIKYPFWWKWLPKFLRD